MVIISSLITEVPEKETRMLPGPVFRDQMLHDFWIITKGIIGYDNAIGISTY